MSAADDLTDRLLSTRKELRGPFETPEFAPEVPEIFARVFTLASEQGVKKWIQDDNPRGFAELVARNARSSDGELIFKPVHAAALEQAAAGTAVKRMAIWIMQSDEALTLDQAAGN